MILLLGGYIIHKIGGYTSANAIKICLGLGVIAFTVIFIDRYLYLLNYWIHNIYIIYQILNNEI
jgi:hypothetical protein